MPVQAEVQGFETRITPNPADQFDPSISGDWVAYSDRRGADADIYIYNLLNGTERLITSGGGDQLLSDISGDLVVYTDYGLGNADVCLYNITSRQTTRLTTNPANQMRTSISGHRVVYQDDRSGDWNIRMFNLDTMNDVALTSDPANQLKPDISGSRVVWEDHRSGDAEIYLMDLNTNQTINITNSPSQETDPMIDGDIVTYASDHFSTGDIYYYRISTGQTFAVTNSSASYECHPTVSSDYIVYENYLTGHSHLWLYSISQGISWQLTNASSDQYLHDSWGNRVVYTDNRNGNLDIYATTITGLTPEVVLRYDDGTGETYPAIESTQYLRQVFDLSQLEEMGDFLVTKIQIDWGSTSSDFACAVKLRDIATGILITAFTVTNPSAGWHEYDVQDLGLVSHRFAVELWQTSGFGYLNGDKNVTDLTTLGMSQISANYGVSWSPFSPSMNFMIRAVVIRPHYNVAVTDVAPYKTVIGRGYPLSVRAAVENQGNVTETFLVSAKAGSTIVETRQVTIPHNNRITLTFTWDTGSAPYGTYTISANASQVQFETDLSDNTYVYGEIKLTIPGDIDGDFFVNIQDATQIGLYWLQTVPPAPANVDINGDGIVNIEDATIVGINWLQQA
jgi:beta propeller repeat protein